MSTVESIARPRRNGERRRAPTASISKESPAITGVVEMVIRRPILTDALDEEKWLNMLGTFVKDWFRYESHFVHGRDSLVDILKERGLLSESDAVQPLIGKKS